MLWARGDLDIVIADSSPWEICTLGEAGQVPGWPGIDTTPPQQMVAQIRGLLERYEAAGGSVRSELFAGSGHAPFLDAGADRFAQIYFEFLDEAEEKLAAQG